MKRYSAVLLLSLFFLASCELPFITVAGVDLSGLSSDYEEIVLGDSDITVNTDGARSVLSEDEIKALRTWNELTLSDEHRAKETHWLSYPFRMYVDDSSSAYLSGTIDPAVSGVPEDVRERLFDTPEEGIWLLASFLKDKGAAFGPSKDQFHYLKRVHDFLITTVAYDHHYFADDQGAHSWDPYEYLLYKPRPYTVCSGYTVFMIYMAQAVGIEAAYVSGLSRDWINTSGEGESSHAWMSFQLEGRWYIIDATNDYIYSYKDNVVKEEYLYSDDSLFLSPEAKLVYHMATDSKEQYIDEPLSLDEFYANMQVKLSAFSHTIAIKEPKQFEAMQKIYLSESASRTVIRDQYVMKDGAISFDFVAPSHYTLEAFIKDESKHTFVLGYSRISEKPEAELMTNFTVELSAPDIGDYRVYLSYRNKLDYDDYGVFYTFSIKESKQAGETF